MICFEKLTYTRETMIASHIEKNKLFGYNTTQVAETKLAEIKVFFIFSII